MKKRRILAGITVLILTLIVLWHEPLLINAARWLNVGEPPRRADYVMVLPGGIQQRPFVAVAMMKAGLAQGVLTAETEIDPAREEGLGPTEDSILREILRLRGIREDQVHVLPGRSNSTWTDALMLAKFMREHPQTTIAIVTNNFHTRRSRWVFQRVLGAESKRVFFVSAPLDRVNENTWWKTEEGLSTYLSEYSKLLIYVGSDRTTIAAGFVIALVVFVGLLRRIMSRQNIPGNDQRDSPQKRGGVKIG